MQKRESNKRTSFKSSKQTTAPRTSRGRTGKAGFEKRDKDSNYKTDRDSSKPRADKPDFKSEERAGSSDRGKRGAIRTTDKRSSRPVKARGESTNSRTRNYSEKTNDISREKKYSTRSDESKEQKLSTKSTTTNFKPRKNDDKIRLNRYLSNSGVCSRREADTYIETGCVTVNGKIVTEMGTKVSLYDEVRFSGQLLSPQNKVYLLLNKPKGYVTTTDDPQERKTVMDLVKNACTERIYPVGRLDLNTSGVLLFTNDGELSKKLTHPSYNMKKIYHVYLDKGLTKNHLLEIAHGIDLEDGRVSADAISYVKEDNKNEIGIEIHSGRNRIVRRIFEHFGYTVEKLDRVYFAGLTKKNLPRGKWRFLTQAEVNQLKML